MAFEVVGGVYLAPQRVTLGFLILALTVVTACNSVSPVKVVKVTPPPLRPVEHHVEPMAMPISGQIQQTLPPDSVGLAIIEAQLRFAHGEDLYKQGLLKQAKEEFDAAIDVLLENSSDHPRDTRLEREITDMVARVHALELAALRNGDGLTDQAEESAPIDDLQQVETFPADIDPRLRQEVEDEIKAVSHDLPIEINDRVLGFLDYYQRGRGRSTVALGLERVGRYQQMMEQILKEEGVPLDLIYLCQAESAFQPRALSRAKAKGMWQFIPSRGKEYGLRQTWWIDERSDPEKSTRAAARHLKDLYAEFGDWYLAMAAYNAGPVRVQRAMEKTGADNFWTLAQKRALPKETINYIPNILALTIIGKNPEKYGFIVQPAAPQETERVPVDKATDLRVIAEAISVPVEDLRTLNAHVLRWTTPPDDPEFELILPKGYAEKFTAQVSSLPESKRILFKEHVVRKGDTLNAIARKYGSSVAELTQANNLRKKPSLQVGQSLIIPMSGVAPPQTAYKSTPNTSAKTTTYTVRRGDTLARIATSFRTTVPKLMAWNNLSSSHLTVGRRLLVAERRTEAASASSSTSKEAASASLSTSKIVHNVRPGETLYGIASSYNTSVDAILSWNNHDDLSVLHPGDRITIFTDENR